MPLDERAVKRACRGADGQRRASTLPFGAGDVPSSSRERRAAHRRLHAGSAAVLRSRRRRRHPLRQYPRDRRLVERCEGRRPKDGGTDRGRRRAVPPKFRTSAHQRRRALDLRPRRSRDRGAPICSKDHLDVTVLIRPPAEIAPPARREFPVVKGTIHAAKGHLGAFELTVDDYRRAGAVVARRAELRAVARMARTRAATSSSTSPAARRCFRRMSCATAICAPIRGDPAAVMRTVLKARDLVGTFDKPRYHRLQRRALRAFALARSSAAPAASISARPARSRRPATMSRSTPHICAGCGDAPPSARPAPPPTPCRQPTR